MGRRRELSIAPPVRNQIAQFQWFNPAVPGGALASVTGILTGRPREERQDWIDKRVGTVHTFQGKEAEAVILMLGAGRGAKAGSRNWAGGTPNLLNVAATRAKRALYIVCNREEWRGAGVFSEAAHILDVRPAQEWMKA